MKCPFCGSPDTQVLDSRVSEGGDSIRRRRRCLSCRKRFTTYETAELRLPQIVKQNGTRADFDVSRIRNGFQRALHKRPVPTEYVDQAVERIVQQVLGLRDRECMRRALDLAARGLFTATPNPRVGCVLVRDGRVIGEGWHERAGEAHAETRALADAKARGEATPGATLYVTLEPCNHYGRTPPCTDGLLAAGIGRVVAAMRDPNPIASRGGERLAAAGIAVEYGLCEDDARE